MQMETVKNRQNISSAHDKNPFGAWYTSQLCTTEISLIYGQVKVLVNIGCLLLLG